MGLGGGGSMESHKELCPLCAGNSIHQLAFFQELQGSVQKPQDSTTPHPSQSHKGLDKPKKGSQVVSQLNQ